MAEVATSFFGRASDSEVHRNTYRLLCFLAGALSPAFGMIYQFTDAGATDPLWARFGLSVLTLLLLSLSYMNAWVERHFIRLVHGLFYLLTAYFVGVTALNGFAPNYALGLLFAMTAIGVAFSLGLNELRPLGIYLLAASVMGIAAVLLTSDPQVSPTIVSVSLLSTGVILFVVARSKVQVEKTMDKTEERYRTLVDAANDAIFIADPDADMLVEANRKAQELVGYSLDEIRRMRPRELYPAGRREHYERLFQKHVYEEEPIAETLHVEAKGGRQIPVDVSASLIEVGDKRLIQGIFRDATERQRVEEQLIEAKEHAEELLQLKSSFMNNMSHELRTPLTSILGYAEVLAEQARGEEQEFAGHIVGSAKRLRRTLNSVLELAELEGGKATLELAATNLAEEVPEAVSLLRPLAEKKGLALNTVVSSREAYAKVDAACLTRIINNLVGNAIKFTDEGRVTVGVGTEAGRTYLRVEDTGVGISDDFKAHLFDEFRQESSGLSRTHEGNGLGLAITKRLVERMGGRIEVTSEKGVGSTFTVFFPHLSSNGASGAEAPPLQETVPLDVPMGRALVVEDNARTRELVAHQLKGLCHTETAEGPKEALDLARRQTFDLFLLDIHLGADQNGEDVLRALREMPEYQGAPAVALTAYALPADRERFLEVGFDEHLGKPFTTKQLLGTIRGVLGEKQPAPNH